MSPTLTMKSWHTDYLADGGMVVGDYVPALLATSGYTDFHSHGGLVGQVISDYAPTIPAHSGHNDFHTSGGLVGTVSAKWSKGSGGPAGDECQNMVQTETGVRRLTPEECERLQGFPTGWTRIEWKGRQASACPDGHRYRVIGNAMSTNVVEWIGRRIAFVDGLKG